MVSLQWPCKSCQKGGFDEKEERWSREAEPGWWRFGDAQKKQGS
jgi:hypothetical protein